MFISAGQISLPEQQELNQRLIQIRTEIDQAKLQFHQVKSIYLKKVKLTPNKVPPVAFPGVK